MLGGAQAGRAGDAGPELAGLQRVPVGRQCVPEPAHWGRAKAAGAGGEPGVAEQDQHECWVHAWAHKVPADQGAAWENSVTGL